MSPDPLEVLLIDDQLGARRATELLVRDGGFRVAGIAGTTDEAHGLLRRRRYDVALIELMLGGAPVTELLGELLAERPGAPVVVHAGRDAPPEALAAVTGLAVPGIVLAASPPATLWEALRAVAAGRTLIDSELDGRLPRRPTPPIRVGIAKLSPREREILLLLAEGCSGAEIAQRLYLSTETVRTHVRNAVQKLGARTRTQAVAQLVAASV